MNTAILGWGSLLWDRNDPTRFDEQHRDWESDGPCLKLEFSRISEKRRGALTLVVDPERGASCRVAYAFSKRDNPDDAICDLRCREETCLKNIGFCFPDGSKCRGRDSKSLEAICAWAREKGIDAVVWTDLKSNFEDKTHKTFSVCNAITYIEELKGDNQVGFDEAVEYVCKAPCCIDTPLRRALRLTAWFPKPDREKKGHQGGTA